MSAVSATEEAMAEAEKHQSRSEELKTLVATAREAVERARKEEAAAKEVAAAKAKLEQAASLGKRLIKAAWAGQAEAVKILVERGGTCTRLTPTSGLRCTGRRATGM